MKMLTDEESSWVAKLQRHATVDGSEMCQRARVYMGTQVDGQNERAVFRLPHIWCFASSGGSVGAAEFLLPFL